MNKTILVTGGAGFIGSHTCVALLEAGHDVDVLDNLCNSDAGVLERVARICAWQPVFMEGDMRYGGVLNYPLDTNPVSAVMHVAGWQVSRTLEARCADAWRWQNKANEATRLETTR